MAVAAMLLRADFPVGFLLLVVFAMVVAAIVLFGVLVGVEQERQGSAGGGR